MKIEKTITEPREFRLCELNRLIEKMILEVNMSILVSILAILL